jgi:hypothetical protein
VIYIYIYIYLTAIGLTPGGRRTVHIYTQTIHKNNITGIMAIKLPTAQPALRYATITDTQIS